MAVGNLRELREQINGLLAQGLQIASPDELDTLSQGLSALHLEQPAALLKQIQQHVANGTVEQKDIESLVKVLQTVSQAEIHLSEADLLKRENLVKGYNAVYVSPDAIPPPDVKDLHAILSIPHTSIRGLQVMEYFKNAPYDELVRSIEIAWFDYAVSNFISEGLRERPGEAIKLAQIALNRKNLIMKRTGLKVLERVGRETSKTQDILDILAKRLEKSKAPMKYIIEETIAKVEGCYDEYLAKKQHTYRYRANNIKQLTSSKKSERYAGIYGLTHVKDPYFTDILARTLAVEEDKKNIKFLLRGLVEIRGFDAIRTITRLLDGPYTRQALEALSKFGDRSALTFIFSRLEPKAIPAYYREIILSYGSMALEPLLHTLKRMEDPATYKSAFASIFVSIRSGTFVQNLIEEAERDPVFAGKFVSLMQRMYPKQFKRPKKKGQPSPTFEAIKPLIRSLLGGEFIAKPNLSAFTLTPDGKYLITLARGEGVEMFRTTTWKREGSVKTDGYPLLMSITSDGKYLLTVKWVSAHRKYIIEVWEFGQWEHPCGSISEPTQINAVNATSDNKYLLLGGEQTIKVLEFGTWREVIELKGHDGRVGYIQSIPDQKETMTGDWRGWLQIWDETTWNQVGRFKSDSWAPRFAELSSDGKLLIYGGYIGIKIWGTDNWREIVSLTKPKNIDCIALTPDGKYIIVGTAKKLRFLEFVSWKEMLTLESDNNIGHILITPDGKYIITFGNKGIRVWNVDLSLIKRG